MIKDLEVEKKKAETDSYTPCNALAYKLSHILSDLLYLSNYGLCFLLQHIESECFHFQCQTLSLPMAFLCLFG